MTNGLAFSYPGYNEMLDRASGPAHQLQRVRPESERLGVRVAERPAGAARPRRRLRHLGDLQGHLQRRAQPPAAARRAGTCPTAASSIARQELLNALYRTTTALDDEDVYDAFMQVPLLDSFAHSQPRVLFVGYGETDNWAHAGRYDLVLHAAHMLRPLRRGAVEHAAAPAATTATRPPSSSPPTTAAAAARSSGKSTASSRRARRTSGSR